MTVRVVPNHNNHNPEQHNDSKSLGSYRSTHSTRSSVLERAREYNRRIDEQKQQRRSKSLERHTENSEAGASEDGFSAASGTPRSQSAGRMPASAHQGNRPATRERALASVQRESGGSFGSVDPSPSHSQNSMTNSSMAPTPRSNTHNNNSNNSNNNAYSSHVSRPKPTTPRMSGGSFTTTTASPSAAPSPSAVSSSPRQAEGSPPPVRGHSHSSQQQQQQPVQQQQHRSSSASSSNHQQRASKQQNNRESPTRSSTAARSIKSSSQRGGDQQQPHEAVVTPELLVDALSGHEDGLLAIAERLMEHYDSGYDVMGEAIIDAFADVQKLFQHVVEAAHMEGAAFEASRKEEEIAELRNQVASAGGGAGHHDGLVPPVSPEHNNNKNGNNTNGPVRHDEFIDQDVKDILSEAIRKGTGYRDSGKFTECFELFERACQSASALLPVDSDHRGRLQLSIARAESMNHERACAILRYAMDDVLRSGLRAGSVPLPDPSQRADVVLNRPKAGQTPGITGPSGQVGVGQSSEEALNSLVEEMREVMSAPVYNNTPLQSVAKRFLSALADAQKQQSKNEEKLEQNLAKLKGDFLLARAEWEEKLNSSQETAEMYKEKYQKLKESRSTSSSVPRSNGTGGGMSSNESYLDHARSALASQQQRVGSAVAGDEGDTYGGFHTLRSTASRAGSQASLGSGLANHARSIVGSFSCVGSNPRSGGVVAQELSENRDAEIREMAFRHDSGLRDRDRRRTTTSEKRHSGNQSNTNINMTYSDRSFSTDTHSQQSGGYQRRTPHSVASGSTRSKSSRSFREYSRSPQRVDF